MGWELPGLDVCTTPLSSMVRLAREERIFTVGRGGRKFARIWTWPICCFAGRRVMTIFAPMSTFPCPVASLRLVPFKSPDQHRDPCSIFQKV